MSTLAERLRKMDEAKAFDRAYYIRRIWPEVCAVVKIAEGIDANGSLNVWRHALKGGLTDLARRMDEEKL